jgi:hypothetical protein
MSQLVKKFIGTNQVDETKIRLSNNANLKARNAADSADVNIIKVNGSDQIEFASVPLVGADATLANQLVRKSQLDSALEGLKPKEAVRVASTGTNVVIASALENGDTLDGITLATGNRVLLKDQTNPIENGIYVVQATGAAVRSSDMNASAEFPRSYLLTTHGTANQGKGYVCTVDSSFVLNTDPATFVQFSSSGSVVGGDMITVSGSNISVDLASVSGLESTNPGNNNGQLRVKLEASNPSIQIDGSNQIGVKIDTARGLSSGASGLGIDVAAAGALEFSSGDLAVKLEASNPSLQISSNALGVKFSATTSGLEKVASGLAVNTEASNPTLEVNGSGELKVKFDTAQGLAQGANGLEIDLDAAGALEFNSGDIRINVDATNGTSKVNGSNELEVVKQEEAQITLGAGDITNQYIDLSHTARAISCVALVVEGGIKQERGVDYTVSLAGGGGGVTRITFAGDLATAGDAALVSGDKLLVSYEYL